MRFVRCVFRWSFYVMGVWLLFVAYLVLGHVFPIVGYMAYILPFVGVAYLFRHRLARRLPWVAALLTRFPRRMKHRFERAFKDEIGEDGKPSVPKVERIEHLEDERVRYHLTLPANQNFRGLSQNERAKVEARWEWLLDCRKVTIHSDTLRGRQGTVTVDHLPEPPDPDYTGNLGQWPGWPGADDFSEPIPLGVREDNGDDVGLRLVTEGGCKNILIFGVPGSGKSVGAAEIIGTAVQDPSVDLWGADGGGGTDMEFWRPRMSHYEVLPERVFLMLGLLKEEIDRRSQAMVAAKRRKIDPHDNKIVLVLEEFATFTDEKVRRSTVDGLPCKPTDPGEKMIDRMAYIGRLGRKYGISLVAIVQVPTVDAVPGKVRRLFQIAWGFRCRDAQGWRAGFGPGVAFVRLNADRPGDSVLLPETGATVRMRSYFIPDPQLDEIAGTMAPLRSRFVPPGDPPSPGGVFVDSRLGNGENPVPPGVSTLVSPGAAEAVSPSVSPGGLRLGPKDLAALQAALDPLERRLLILRVWSGSSYGGKRLAALERAGYFSVPARPDPTMPKTIITTLKGREALKSAGESQA